MKTRVDVGSSSAAEYARRTPGLNAIACHRQRAKRSGMVCTYERHEWYVAYHLFGGRCVYCGEQRSIYDMQMDMFVPSSLGGGFTADNVVPSCVTCNKMKKDRHPIEIADEHVVVKIERVLADVVKVSSVVGKVDFPTSSIAVAEAITSGIVASGSMDFIADKPVVFRIARQS